MSDHTVAIYLARNPMECRVLLDGRDITDACRGISVDADVGQSLTRVELRLIASVEIIGDAGRVELRKPGDAGTDRV